MECVCGSCEKPAVLERSVCGVYSKTVCLYSSVRMIECLHFTGSRFPLRLQRWRLMAAAIRHNKKQVHLFTPA